MCVAAELDVQAGRPVTIRSSEAATAQIRGFVTRLADRDARRRLRALQRERVTSIEPEALGRVVMSEGGRYGQHDR